MSKSADDLDKTVWEYLVECANTNNYDIQLELKLLNKTLTINVQNIVSHMHDHMRKIEFETKDELISVENYKFVTEWYSRESNKGMWYNVVRMKTDFEFTERQILVPDFSKGEIYEMQFNKYYAFVTIYANFDSNIPTIIFNKINYENWIKK